MPRKSWRAGRGALVLIAVLLGASGLLRLGGGTGAALAREVAALRDADATAAAMADDATGCEPGEDFALVIEALEARETRLTGREDALADRAQALELAEAEIAESLAALEAAESRLDATMARAETAAEGDLDRLTAVYESMKPKQAAALFEQMAPGFAAGFLARMQPVAAAEVMAGLTPETAYTISVMLAGRNAEAPTE